MNQILRCDWLPERARWRYLACSVLATVSRKKNFLESHIINPLLTKLVKLRWLDIGLVLFGEYMVLDSVSVHNHAKKKKELSHCQHTPISSFTRPKSHNFNTTRICVRLSSRSSRFASSGPQSTSCNLRSEVYYCMQSNLQSTAWKCQTPVRNSQRELLSHKGKYSDIICRGASLSQVLLLHRCRHLL